MRRSLKKASIRLPEIDPDVAVLLVPAGVVPRGLGIQEMLARAFGNHDHGAFAFGQAVAQCLEQAARAVEIEAHFGDQNEIHIAARERGVARDEARIAAHQLDHTDAIDRRRSPRRRALRTACTAIAKAVSKPNDLVEIHDVVVDRLRDADDRLLQPAPLASPRRAPPRRAACRRRRPRRKGRCFISSSRSTISPMSCVPARAAEDGAAEIVNLRDTDSGFRLIGVWP